MGWKWHVPLSSWDGRWDKNVADTEFVHKTDEISWKLHHKDAPFATEGRGGFHFLLKTLQLNISVKAEFYRMCFFNWGHFLTPCFSSCCSRWAGVSRWMNCWMCLLKLEVGEAQRISVLSLLKGNMAQVSDCPERTLCLLPTDNGQQLSQLCPLPYKALF